MVSPVLTHKTVTIANGASDSGVLALDGELDSHTLVGFWSPSALTGTAYSFKVAETSGGTYRTVSGVTKTHANDTYFPLDPKDTVGWRYIKFTSNGTEGSERTIRAAVRKVY